MGKSSFDYTTPSSTIGTSSSLWESTLAVGKNIFDFYDSKGDVTISGTTEIDSDVSGPIVVARYGVLTVNAKLTVKNPCRGFVVLCDTLSMGASGDISMTGKGCAGSPTWTAYDLSFPESVSVSAQYIRLTQYLAAIRSNGWFLGDPVLADLGDPLLGDALATITPGTALLAASGCGAGATHSFTTGPLTEAAPAATGQSGSAGSQAPGGGGGGGAYAPGGVIAGANGASGGYGGAAHPWSGGDAGFGALTTYGTGRSGSSLGAGNSTPGGVLLVLCRGTITAASGHSFSARSANESTDGKGSSGGGFIAVGYNALSGTLNLVATQGTPGGGAASGGTGGPGATMQKTWAELGWS
jgi:hypothetical protein